MSSDSSPDSGFELHCLDVGQGNSTVVVLPSEDPNAREALVIDSPDTVATIDCLERRNVTRLRLVLITHSDDDHAKGIPGVLSRYAGRVSALAYNLDRSTIADKSWQRALLHVINSTTPNHVYRAVDDITDAHARDSRVIELLTFEGAKYGEILYPHPEDVRAAAPNDAPNHACAVVSLWLDDFRALLGSDLSLTGWSILCSRLTGDLQTKLRAHLFQYPHHGAELAVQSPSFPYNGQHIQALSGIELLRLVDPEIVLISVGTVQPPNYQHPRPATFELLTSFRQEREARGERLHIACTELTARCLPSPAQMRSDAISWQRTDRRDINFAERKEGACPCAGTFSLYIPADGTPHRYEPDALHQAFVDRVQRQGGNPGCRRTRS